MAAPQDVWAKPLAEEMISEYRCQSLVYVKVSFGAYDEVAGNVPSIETKFNAAGAVMRSKKAERNGVQQGHEVEAWVDHKTVPWPVTSSDRLEYLGRKWKVTEVASYGSGSDGTPVGPVYLTSLDGKVIATLDGKPFITQGVEGGIEKFTMYASRITARAE